MTFLEKFEQLRLETPHIGLQCVNNTNSPFCQYTERSKNCYMTFASYQSEDCYYNTRVFYCTDCSDCTLCYKCELCYECLDCINSYNCNFCDHCENSRDSDFCYYCISAKNCFGCVGLNQAEYCIFNEQFSAEEYAQKAAEFKKLPISGIYLRLKELEYKTPRNAMYGKKNEKSYGENLHNSKNTFWAFDSKGMWDCNHVYHCDDSRDLQDCSHLGWSELCYEIMSGGGLNNCMFCYGCWDSRDLMYCDSVYNSRDCFLCTGLNHGKFCILNEPFSEENYHARVDEIKARMKTDGEWGKWFKSGYSEVLTYGL